MLTHIVECLESKVSIIVILVTKAKFSTTKSSKKVFPPTDVMTDTEMAMWPPKPDVFISLEQ